MICAYMILSIGFCKNPIPKFSAMSTNGKVFTEKSFVQKPTVLFFIKDGCPANPGAFKNFNRLSKDLGDSAQVIAVINADLKAATKLATQLKVPFPIIPDPNKKVIKGCNAEKSLDFTVIATTNTPKFPKLWTGYSKASVQEALTIIEKHGKKLKRFDLSEFPGGTVSGCML